MARLPSSNCIFARKLPYAPGFTSRFKAARPFYIACKRAGLCSTIGYRIGFSASAPAFHEKDENRPTGCAYVFIVSWSRCKAVCRPAHGSGGWMRSTHSFSHR